MKATALSDGRQVLATANPYTAKPPMTGRARAGNNRTPTAVREEVAASAGAGGGAVVEEVAAVVVMAKGSSRMWNSWIGRRRGSEQEGRPQPHLAPAELPVPVVKLAVAPNEGVAQVWRSVLESEGLPCYLKCAGVGPADYTTSVCPHALYVFASHAKQARRLLGLS